MKLDDHKERPDTHGFLNGCCASESRVDHKATYNRSTGDK